MAFFNVVKKEYPVTEQDMFLIQPKMKGYCHEKPVTEQVQKKPDSKTLKKFQKAKYNHLADFEA